jgi:hypothetical protein
MKKVKALQLIFIICGCFVFVRYQDTKFLKSAKDKFFEIGLSKQLKCEVTKPCKPSLMVYNPLLPVFSILCDSLWVNAVDGASSFLRETEEDFVFIGAINPDTVLTIYSDTVLYGNHALLNNALLRVVSGRLFLYGNLYLLGNSSIIFEEGSGLFVYQAFSYDKHIFCIDSSSFVTEGSSINSCGFPFTMINAANSRLTMRNTIMNTAFITFAPMHNAVYEIYNTDKAGEFVLLGDSISVNVSESDSVLVWLGFPRGSEV